MGFRFNIPSRVAKLVPTGNNAPTPAPTPRQNAGAIKARSYGYRSGAAPLASGQSPATEKPLPLRGAQANTTSEPASRRMIDADAFNPGRGFMSRTEDTLNTGRVPNRINRNTPATNAGVIAVAGYPAGVNGWPYDGNALFIPHQIIPRRPITVTPFQRTIDSSITVSAAPIGGPVS